MKNISNKESTVEFLGRDGIFSGSFALKINGRLHIGTYESDPRTVKYNGIELLESMGGMAFRFDRNIHYSDERIESLLAILRASYSLVFLGGVLDGDDTRT